MTPAYAYFAPLVLKPVVIDAPGIYRTRSGDPVIVTQISTRHDFGCRGYYNTGMKRSESWHKSGRILATSETPNDVVAPWS